MKEASQYTAIAQNRISDEPVAPAKIFDDVYFVGRRIVGVFVVPTSEGLVMIDSMDPCDADEKHIVPGLQKLGFRPEDINTIIITHGHFDHFAGAKRLQDKYGCKVAMGLIDSAFMVTSEYPSKFSTMEYPRIDVVLKDKEPLVFGKHTFIPVLTPGHTPGGMSLIFNVHDNGEEHWASLWVGCGIPRETQCWDSAFNGVGPQLQAACDFVHSLYIFEKECEKHKCDVVLGVHPHRCNLFEKLKVAKDRKPDEPSPFVDGANGVKKNLQDLGHNVIVQITRIIDEM